MRWLREHLLVTTVAALGVGAFALFSWSEYGYFCDQNRQHNELLRHVGGQVSQCQRFWSDAHLHDWVYNAASNWQSELLFGVLLVVVLHKAARAAGHDGEAEDT